MDVPCLPRRPAAFAANVKTITHITLARQPLPALEKSGSAGLFRIKSNLKAKRVKPLSDGSALVEIAPRCPDTRRRLDPLTLREITADIHYQGTGKPLAVHLWTTLPDETKHPGNALVKFHATRW